MKKAIFVSAFLAMFLSGCMYPKEELSKNQIPNDVQLETVQKAVDQYRKETNGLLPIKTKPEETPIYEKYIIDFAPLKERGLIQQTPGNSFEGGGFYQYVIINPEDRPQVKLIDLRIAEEIRNVRIRLESYRSVHTYPPFGKPVTNRVYRIDYKKLDLKAYPEIESPYSGKKLPIVMDPKGNLFVDYRPDLLDMIKERSEALPENKDIRYLLAEHSPFVPAFSLPTASVNGEPVFMD